MGNNQYQKYVDLVQDKLIQEINTQTYKQQKFQQLEEAISILPNYYLAHLELFKLKIMDDKYYVDIEYDFNLAIELNPKYLQIDPDWVLEVANYTEEVSSFMNNYYDMKSYFVDDLNYQKCLYNSIKQLENQNYYQAYFLLRIAAKIQPQGYEIYFIMGKLFLEKLYIKEAFNYFHKFINHNPNHLTTLFQLAEICLFLDQRLEARNYLSLMKDFKVEKNSNGEQHFFLNKLYEMFCQTYLFDDENIIDFILELERVVKQTRSSVLNHKISLYISNCKYETDRLYQFYQNEPYEFWRQYKLILLLIISAKYTEAEQQIIYCLKQFTNSDEKSKLLNAKGNLSFIQICKQAQVLFQLNRLIDCVNLITEILDKNMDSTETYPILYQCYQQSQSKKDLKEILSLNQTIKLIQTGIDKNISVGDLNSMIGKILFDNQKFNEAKQYFIQAIKQNSQNYRIDRLQLTYCYTIDPDDQFESIMTELNEIIGSYEKKKYKKQ